MIFLFENPTQLILLHQSGEKWGRRCMLYVLYVVRRTEYSVRRSLTSYIVRTFFLSPFLFHKFHLATPISVLSGYQFTQGA